jgi:hypothetical protein
MLSDRLHTSHLPAWSRLISSLLGVGGALFVVAVHLAHRGVQVDRHGPITGASTSRPRSAQELLAEPVELADMPEGERAQCSGGSIGGLPAQRVAIVPAHLLRSALGNDRVLPDADVALLATTALTSLRPAA